MEAQRLPPESQASSEPATSTDDFLVVDRVPVIGKIVATGKLTSRQRAEQVAANDKASGLEVEIREPASEAAR